MYQIKHNANAIDAFQMSLPIDFWVLGLYQGPFVVFIILWIMRKRKRLFQYIVKFYSTHTISGGACINSHCGPERGCQFISSILTSLFYTSMNVLMVVVKIEQTPFLFLHPNIPKLTKIILTNMQID